VRRLSTIGGALVLLALLFAAMGPAGAATPAASPTVTGLTEVKVSGLLDPVLVSFVEKSIRSAEASNSSVLLQLSSSGSVVSGPRLAGLLELVRHASVPVAVWVGPSGKATGGAGQLAAVADVVGISAGSHLGNFGDPVIDPSQFTPAFRAQLDRLTTGTVNADEALRLHLAPHPAPVLGDMVLIVPGVRTQVVHVNGRPQQTLAKGFTETFTALPIGDQLMHTAASPPVAYLMFTFGMALILFELFTAGVGVAGLVGAGGFLLGSYGLAVLPVHPWAVVLLVVSMLAFGVDVQTGVPRVWTVVGVVTFSTGSVFLFDGVSMSWITMIVGIGGVVVFMLAGMPAMVRTRFSTPTIGRGWMIGEEGEAVADISPDGVVRVRGALWRARTNRATPLSAGDPIRVVEVDGLLLEVEPIEGGAKDYRH
jgi:membrane-bound serine protease (ClpP class)